MKMQRITRVMHALLATVMLCAGIVIAPKANAAVVYPSNLYLTQVSNVTCTLVSNAMMLRARMYLSNNSNWGQITENSLAPYSWIEGAGQRSTYSCSFAGCSFNVKQAYVNGLTVSQLQNILAAHPEGICIYVTSIPHAQWITDVENGVVYSGDSSCPAYFGRRPLANTLQGQCCGYNQQAVLNNVTSYWYVASYNVFANANYNTTTTTTLTRANLPNGTYRIACYGNTKYGIDVSGASTADEGNVQVWEYTGGKNQQFKVTFSKDHYNIQATHSSKNLDLMKAGSAAGTSVIQYTPDGTAVQNWVLQDAGDGAYYIVNSNGLYMDVNGGTVANGTNIQGWTGNKSDAQKWIFVAVDGKQSIPDGDYQIRSAKDFNFGVDVKGNSTESSGTVHLWTMGTGNNQKWAVKYLGDGFYSIIAKHSGLALNCKGGAIKGNPDVQQYTFASGDAASMWMLKDAGNGSFYVVNKTGHFLDVNNAKFENGTNIQGWTGNSSDAQKWKFVAVNGTQTIENGVYNICSAADEKFGLDVASVSTEARANVHLWTLGEGENQQWHVDHLGNGYYSISAVHSGKALDVNGASINNLANIQQFDNTATTNDAQQWIIKDAGDGKYYIINKKGLFIDIDGGKIANGTNIQGYVGNRTVAQKWVFKKVSVEKSIPSITDIKVTDITPGGYTVTCTVTDKYGIKNVKMPTWTDKNGQDDIVWHEATLNGNTATFRVKVSDHNNESGVYVTHIYAYSNKNEVGAKAVEKVTVPEPIVDTEAPKISDIKITNVSQAGYKVTCTVTDNVEVKSVKMPTWTNKNGQDDCKWHEATITGNTATFTVKVSDHNNEFGNYVTHIYAYDAAGNRAGAVAGTTDVPVSNGTYRIACASNNAIGLDVAGAGTNNGANVELWTYDYASHQQFTLTLQSDGYYTIKPAHCGRVLDVSGGIKTNGTNIQLYDSNNSDSQRWKIVHNSDDSYTFISKLNNTSALDANGGTIANGTNIQLWEGNNSAAQKWSIISLNEGGGTGSGGYANYKGGRGGSGNILAYGVDVSEHQGVGYNFQALKNAGYKYVILRCGFITRKDYRFEEYYNAAKAAGLDVGAYFYSYASTAAEARTEADKCLSYIAGKKFEYPIYFDFEDPCAYGCDSKSVCLTFLDRVAAQGYLVGLYGYASWLDEDYSGWVPTAQICQKYECWIANYPYANYVDNYTAKYKTRYGMFQFTDGQASQGLAAGAGIDTDICFKDYPSIVRQYGFNGYAASKTPVTYNTGEGVVAPEEVSGLTDITVKSVEKVQYYNVNGQMSEEPFSGINVVVTIYNDGSKDVKKVMK